MKKNLSKILIFILAFQIEVRVKASSEDLQQPEHCLESKEICAIQVGHDFHYEKNKLKLHATQGSTLQRNKDNEWRLVQGAVWVEKGPVEIETAYAQIISRRGEYWVLEEKQKIFIRNMRADLKVRMRDGHEIVLPEGFEVWVEGIDASGRSQYGMIRPIDMKEHIPLWTSLFKGTKEEFKKSLMSYKERWGDLAKVSGALYKEIINRRIAAAEEESAQIELKRRRQEAERRHLKELYWRRTFER